MFLKPTTSSGGWHVTRPSLPHAALPHETFSIEIDTGASMKPKFLPWMAEGRGAGRVSSQGARNRGTARALTERLPAHRVGRVGRHEAQEGAVVREGRARRRREGGGAVADRHDDGELSA